MNLPPLIPLQLGGRGGTPCLAAPEQDNIITMEQEVHERTNNERVRKRHQQNDAPRHDFFGAHSYPETDVILFRMPHMMCGARKKIMKQAKLKQKRASWLPGIPNLIPALKKFRNRTLEAICSSKLSDNEIVEILVKLRSIGLPAGLLTVCLSQLCRL